MAVGKGKLLSLSKLVFYRTLYDLVVKEVRRFVCTVKVCFVFCD